MPCTDDDPGRDPALLRRLALLTGLAGLAAWLAGCAQPRPAPAPLPPPPPPRPVPALPAPAPPPLPPVSEVPAPPPPPAPPQQTRRDGVVALPPAAVARNWDEFRRAAATRMVQAQPARSYMGKPPPMLLGIPVIEIELHGDGSVRSVNVLREPADPRARDTIEIAIDAIRVAAPYGDVSRLPRPWRWTETFLFDGQRRFKPRILDQ